MAKYTVYCFKDYDELLDWESNNFGKYRNQFFNSMKNDETLM